MGVIWAILWQLHVKQRCFWTQNLRKINHKIDFVNDSCGNFASKTLIWMVPINL